MNQHMMQDMSSHMIWMWGIFAAVVLMLILLISFFLKRTNRQSLLIGDLARTAPVGFSRRFNRPDLQPSDPQHLETHDTIFILPDISHYTRFMTGNEFSFAHAQYIVFSLINAMIERATRTVKLSKLEGDAALFYIDADRLTPEQIGETVTGIFQAFFTEQERLLELNLCPCSACRGIADLDLKIFVHRGEAARFEFRGSIDHFGTDVIILHRMMKNNVSGDRYVMVTEAAKGSISMPSLNAGYDIEEEIEHLGVFKARVFRVDDATKAALIEEPHTGRASAAVETFKKIGANAGSLAAGIKRLSSRLKSASGIP